MDSSEEEKILKNHLQLHEVDVKEQDLGPIIWSPGCQMFFNPAPSSGSDSSYNLLFKLIKIRIGFPSNSIYEDIRVKVAFGDLRNI